MARPDRRGRVEPMNRLGESRNPYLRQHADQLIHWQPWDDAALRSAREQNRPIFLSIGYATCHWCHVMAHESFDDSEIAEWLNAHFVSIKVDREERPDLDDAFMLAVQLASGRGGWPMTLFLTPEGEPFFAGTYFPREDRGKAPGFRRMVQSIARAWRDQEDDLRARAAEFAEVWRDASALGPVSGEDLPIRTRAARLVDELRAAYDPEFGGFGPAPKFPPHTALSFLQGLDQPASDAPEMVGGTLAGMLAGGIHDRVGGGFHRYSTDREWRLPHFEKMLVDNALLVDGLIRAGFVEPAERTLEWLDRELRAPDGTYMSGLDADGVHEEGDTYTWTVAEIEAALVGTPDAIVAEFLRAYDVRPEGNFRDEATQSWTGRNVLVGGDDRRFAAQLDHLREVRQSRPLPFRDDKRILHGNGLMLGALVTAGRLEDARRLAARWIAVTQEVSAQDVGAEQPRSWPHQLIGDRAEGQAFADDLAAFGWGLTRLAAATGETYRSVTQSLADQLLRDHFDYESGRFFRTRRDAAVPVQPITMTDQPGPSVQALCIAFLTEFGEREAVERALAASAPWMTLHPLATEALHEAAIRAAARGWTMQPDLHARLTEFGLEVRARPGYMFFAEGGLAPALELAYRSPEPIAPPDAEWRGDHLFIPRGPSGTRVSLRYRVCDDSGCRPWARAEFALYD
ncbi:MAG: thioredoxin domain-containing protein [Fimbriimonadaceae bacterium]|nr:thioredoxin domain-containing protein [Fimbriimonadaceae bacterium]